MTCFRIGIDFLRLNSKLSAALTIVDINLMVGNVMVNMLVMYILIKTKQTESITCKSIFVLSTSDLMIGLFVQNLFMASFYERNCLLEEVLRLLSIFLPHFSFYVIAILGVDRYLRIKYFAKFKTIWTEKVVLTLMCIAFFHALHLGVLALINSMRNSPVAFFMYIAFEGTVVSTLLILQIKTIRTSNQICAISNVSTAERTNKKITKLSLRIMLMFCIFVVPQIIISNLLRTRNQDHFSDNERSLLEFIYCLTLSFAFANSMANAVLFLLTNVKAKRFFRNFVR